MRASLARQHGALQFTHSISGILHLPKMPLLDERKLLRLRSDRGPPARVDDPAVAVPLDTGLPSVLLDEHPVGLGSALGVQIAGPVPARAAAPDARCATAARAADGKDGVTVGGEIRHGNLLRLETVAGWCGIRAGRAAPGRTASGQG